MDPEERKELVNHINEWVAQYLSSDERHTLSMATLNLGVCRKTLYTLLRDPGKVSPKTLWRIHTKIQKPADGNL